jgi:hypothetical protein
MPAKKPAAKKSTRAKKRGGLTSALGPKATTALVICVLAGGLAYGARLQEQEDKLKAKEAAAASMAPDGAVDDAAMAASTGPSKPVTSKKLATNTPATGTVGAAAKASAPASANRAVTVTGCLEKSDEGYRLKDTSGTAAPKSRSWKSGFLKKGAAPVDVVDASHTLALNSHVGHRVAVSGPLTDREIRAESVQRVASSCKAN